MSKQCRSCNPPLDAKVIRQNWDSQLQEMRESRTILDEIQIVLEANSKQTRRNYEDQKERVLKRTMKITKTLILRRSKAHASGSSGTIDSANGGTATLQVSFGSLLALVVESQSCRGLWSMSGDCPRMSQHRLSVILFQGRR